MFTEQEIKEKQEQISVLIKKETEISKQIADLRDCLYKDAEEKAKAKFPDINAGDKVVVYWETWNGNKSETYFFKGVRRSRWWTYSLNPTPNEMRCVFNKVKKDGNPSLREEEISVGKIIKIEKVQ